MPETIFALSSGRPPAAIAVIRISGPRAREAALALAGDLPETRMAMVRILRDPVSGEHLDEALVLRFRTRCPSFARLYAARLISVVFPLPGSEIAHKILIDLLSLLMKFLALAPISRSSSVGTSNDDSRSDHRAAFPKWNGDTSPSGFCGAGRTNSKHVKNAI